MDNYLSFICEYAHHAHWIIFCLLLLAGLNIPISEDILILTGGALASACIPEHTWLIYGWIFFGSWISAWEPYWIGRLLGPKLYDIRWFSHILTRKRIDRLHYYYEKFGILTFIVGRYCPGGVRNALFLTSGLGKMPFYTFIARDGFACLCSTATLFYLGFTFAANYEVIIKRVSSYEHLVLIILSALLLLLLVILWYRKKQENE